MYHISLGLSKIIEKSPWFSPLEKHSKQQQGDSPLRGISPLWWRGKSVVQKFSREEFLPWVNYQLLPKYP